jgi:hypothetical protein
LKKISGMDFKKIIVVSGKSGVFKVIAQSRSGFIAESLIDGKKMPISASNRITSVEDIVVFTETEEVKLREIFQKMKEFTKGEPGIDHKSPETEIVGFFESVLPDYDKERVYVSDMKKMIMWYNLLHKNDMLDFEDEEDEEKKEDAGETNEVSPEKTQETDSTEQKEEEV